MRKLSSSSQIFARAFLAYLISTGVVRAEPIAPVLSPSSGRAPTSEAQGRPEASDAIAPPASSTNPPQASPESPPAPPAAGATVDAKTPIDPSASPGVGRPAPVPATVSHDSRANALLSMPTGVTLRMQVNYAGSWLEARSFDEASGSGFHRLCFAPCRDARVSSEQEIRVVAPGMTPSPVFRLQPGSGAALLTVRGGSQWLRTLGRVGLVVGLPVAGLGMAGLGYGAFEDQAGMRNAGAVTLGVGSALILAALPLLVLGSTSVLNDRGERVATALDPATRW